MNARPYKAALSALLLSGVSVAAAVEPRTTIAYAEKVIGSVKCKTAFIIKVNDGSAAESAGLDGEPREDFSGAVVELRPVADGTDSVTAKVTSKGLVHVDGLNCGTYKAFIRGGSGTLYISDVL